MRGRSALSLPAIVAVVLLGAAYLAFGVLRIDPLRTYITATLTMPQSGGLTENSPVLLSGVHVGQILQVRATSEGVEAKFRIDERHQIPLDSPIRVEYLSALGEPYLLFAPTENAGPFIDDGNTLRTQAELAPLSVSDVAVAVVDLLEQLDPDTIATLVRGAGVALADTAPALASLESSSKLLAATMLRHEPQFRELLGNVGSMYTDIEWFGPSLQTAGPWWKLLADRFGNSIDRLAEGLLEKTPAGDYTQPDGLIPFLGDTDQFLTNYQPVFDELTPVLRPVAEGMTAALSPLDLSDLLANALAVVDGGEPGADGALRLRIDMN